MSYVEVLNQLKKNQVAPIYLIHGSENYFIENIKKQITKQVLHGDLDNLSMYNLEEIPIQEVINDVETYPFFGEKKLIIATNPVFLKAKPEKLSFEHDMDALATYLTNPVDYSVLVIIAAYEKIDERKKASKLLKKHATVANCDPIREKDISKWIKSLVNQLHITLDNDVYEIIETELSTNLMLLEEELTKLALYVGENGHVTKEIAENLIAHTSNSSSLRLVDAVIEGDLYRAISIYKDLEIMKEEPIALIGLLAFQFRTILRVKLLKQKGYSQFQMQKQLGVHPYVVKIAINREKHFAINKLEDIIEKLTDADASMKQGKMEKGLAFELLLFDIIKAA
ncbi:DNA polymerase III subunit delta [Oceanobacillus bengalensis]|uniref:DNA polymerase III subunit delta n=1 Tax=Oceanobacillus bengalensis TaxID=1435466 RepID=A0A494Z5Q2_9BACI|nr:DNA polymerase III subunit delta [Oceanobacillus bengalensis]RKQ17868.1 DNA polymerase III subunit delta [Oceanobacillus bengalensis]